MTSRLFPALLRYWRSRRGLSQLSLALEAGVSARHVSFLESGRSQPREEMVLRLCGVLDVPLRDQNHALRAAGFAPRYPEPTLDAVPREVRAALDQMMAQHEPFPMTVLALDGVIVRHNRAAMAVFGAFLAEPTALPAALDMVTLLFDPRLMRPFVLEWEALARTMVSRMHRESLQRGGDVRLAAALERALAVPGVPRAWRLPDLSTDAPPTLTVRMAREDLRVGFLVAVTTFSAPQQVTLDELRIESCFPLDEETRRTCARLAGAESALA